VFVLKHPNGVFVSYDHTFLNEVTGRLKKVCEVMCGCADF